MVKFYENGRVVKGSNFYFVVLIPKKKNTNNISKYRKISLIGCIYMVNSKVLANKIKKVICLAISKTQTTFILGNLILQVIFMLYNEDN